MRNSIGLIEVEGLVGAIEAADAAAKAANIELVGMELAKGSGLVTIKMEGEVSAVKAGVEAGVMTASKISRVFSKHIIARPNEETYKMIDTYIEDKEIKNTLKEEKNFKEENNEIKELEKLEEAKEAKETKETKEIVKKNHKKNKLK